MSRVEKTVFISYRRANAPWALAISQALTHTGYDVFFDFTGIPSGDFESVILENIAARAHFLIVLTPSALERCHEPGDWLRREIETAIDLKRNIVPLLLENFDFSSPHVEERLTGTLAALKRYSGLEIYVRYFNEGMQRLREQFLNVTLDAVVHPTSEAVRQAAREQQRAAAAAPAVEDTKLAAQRYFERAQETADANEKIRLYSLAIELDPTLTKAFANRGLLRARQGDDAGARADFDEALRLNPTNAWVLGSRGTLRAKQGDYLGARADCDEAIRLNPADAWVFRSRGSVRAKQGDADGARVDFDEAIRLNPADAWVLSSRGILRAEAGDTAGALADFDEALRLDPTDVWVLRSRGDLREEAGDMAGALADLDEALRLNPADVRTLTSRSTLRAEAGDGAGANADFDEALRLDPAMKRGWERLLKRTEARRLRRGPHGGTPLS